MTDAITGNRTVSDILTDINLGPNDSVQMRFAALQMAQSMLCKSAAEDYMNQIENIQAEQKKTSEMIAQMRQLQQECKNKGDDGTVVISGELLEFMQKNELPIGGTKIEGYSIDTYVNDFVHEEGKCGDLCEEKWAAETWSFIDPNGKAVEITLPDGGHRWQWVSPSYEQTLTGSGYKVNSDDLDFNLQSLTNYQESISNKTQTLMVYLQDYIGQYNSFTQGASAQVSQAMQVLTAVATGR